MYRKMTAYRTIGCETFNLIVTNRATRPQKVKPLAIPKVIFASQQEA